MPTVRTQVMLSETQRGLFYPGKMIECRAMHATRVFFFDVQAVLNFELTLDRLSGV